MFSSVKDNVFYLPNSLIELQELKKLRLEKKANNKNGEHVQITKFT